MSEPSTTSVSAGSDSPEALRSKLHHLVVAELLGPKDGPTEQVAETRVSDRYLVGMLAPRSQTAGQEADEGFEDGSEPDESDDGKADPVRTRSDSLLPSSFGMTFVVAAEAGELEVEARWGKYERCESETITHKPRKKDGEESPASSGSGSPRAARGPSCLPTAPSPRR